MMNAYKIDLQEMDLNLSREIINEFVESIEKWWEDNKETLYILEKRFIDTCTMDQLGFIHDKVTGKLIAGSKIEWFNKILGQEDI